MYDILILSVSHGRGKSRTLPKLVSFPIQNPMNPLPEKGKGKIRSK